jgi:hypothetical protein
LIPGLTFDVAKVASRAPVLFPFLDLQLSIPAGQAARVCDAGTRPGHGLLIAIRVAYINRLGGLNNRAVLRARYDAMRLQILRSIIRTTPDDYRANDARFLIGTLAHVAGGRSPGRHRWRGLTRRPAARHPSDDVGTPRPMRAATASASRAMSAASL